MLVQTLPKDNSIHYYPITEVYVQTGVSLKNKYIKKKKKILQKRTLASFSRIKSASRSELVTLETQWTALGNTECDV